MAKKSLPATAYLRVVEGVVVELFTTPDGVALSDCFHEDVAAQFIPMPLDAAGKPATAVQPGWTMTGGKFNPPVEPAPTPDELVGYASAAQDAARARVHSFDVGGGGAAHIVTTQLDPAGAIAMMKVGLWAQMNAGSTTAQLPYSNVDYSATWLSVAEAGSLAVQAGALDAQSYAILNTVVAQIRAVPPGIETRAAVDTAFAVLGGAAA